MGTTRGQYLGRAGGGALWVLHEVSNWVELGGGALWALDEVSTWEQLGGEALHEASPWGIVFFPAKQ